MQMKMCNDMQLKMSKTLESGKMLKLRLYRDVREFSNKYRTIHIVWIKLPSEVVIARLTTNILEANQDYLLK